MPFVTAAVALSKYNIGYTTLHRWRDSGKIQHKVLPSGTFHYWIDDTSKVSIAPLNKVPPKLKLIYARVSSRKQAGELANQISFLSQRYPKHVVVSDIGSGINYKRKGLQTILDHLFRGELKEVVVAYKDRLSRIGFDFFESIFKRFGAVIRVIKTTGKSPDEDLAGDLLEIITVFSARYHGRRSYIDEGKVLSHSDTEDVLEEVSRDDEKAIQ